MTGIQIAAPRPARPERPIRLRLPASRGGLAWIAVLVLVGSFLALQIGREVWTNWSIGQERAVLEAQIVEMEAYNAALQRELDYLNSDAFVSAEVRRLLNMGAPGEHLLIIPPGAAAPLPEVDATRDPVPPPLLDQWLQLFFGP
jgi:cell division protein FtsB